MSEKIVFNGSSTHKRQILKWLQEDEEFNASPIHTRDITVLMLPDGTEVHHGDSIIKHDVNDYEVIKKSS